MFHSKLPRSIRVSHIKFTLRNSRKNQDDQAGRVNFFVNGFIEFRNVPIREGSHGEIRIEFSGIEKVPDGVLTTCILRDDIRREIERQVTEQLLEIVQ